MWNLPEINRKLSFLTKVGLYFTNKQYSFSDEDHTVLVYKIYKGEFFIIDEMDYSEFISNIIKLN